MYRHTHSEGVSGGAHTLGPRFNLDHCIEHLAHWLPSQKPLKDFVHHNTLHAVQDRPFHEGVAVAAKIFGARSYLPLADYQARYRQGRIQDYAIDWALARTVSDAVKRDELRRSLFEEDHNIHYPPISLANHGIRERWLTHIEVNLDVLVHPVLFRLLANFLDQGISRWTVARQDETLWDCLWRLVENSFIPLYPLNEAKARSLLSNTPDEAIAICLAEIVGSEKLYEQYLLEMQLAHPGWSGMVRVIEEDPKTLLAQRQVSLKQLIAVELVLQLAFLRLKAGENFLPVVQVPQMEKVHNLTDAISRPHVPLRLKIWHEAMEYSLYGELLHAINHQPSTPVKAKVTAQALFCLDDRECSLRRHLEEINPAIETFGAAGFFGIDFLYKGIDDAYPVAQCPVVVSPRHLILESKPQQTASKTQKADLSKLHFKPYTLLRGWLFTQTLGLGYAARLAWDVFKPGSKPLKIQQLGELDAHTQLHLLRESDETTEDGRLLGFSHSEMADRIEGLLWLIGLTQNFAPLVVVIAHGSSSVNNPHFAAYDCGACAGKPGAPNARAFAWMANDPTVRGLLQERGIQIPDETRFIAALHNTSRDEVVYFDKPLWADNPPQGLEMFQQNMTEALSRNAHERCRWFELGPKADNARLSQAHVQHRATSIFEPRPELNHSNNLYAVVGRRSLTSDLFLDRRAFLHSYDPTSDVDGSLLVKILSAVIPVCGGINLEYLFSRIDNSIYGAGTKLPHNVIGLLGVANGVEGDLRTGLPSQMIEVHEPARLLIVVEQTNAIAELAIARLGELREWLDNQWVRLACCHPETRQITLYGNGLWTAVELPDDLPLRTVHSSKEAYIGQTQTIPVKRIAKRSAT